MRDARKRKHPGVRLAMASDQKTSLVSQSQEIQQFLAWTYWLVGTFCFYWETLVFVTVIRAGTNVELPLLGRCEASEGLIFTLSFFWPVLLGLHLIVRTHQSLVHRSSFTAQFPGVLGDKEIPRPLGYLRVLLFVTLVAWPTGLHVFHTWRTFTEMEIVLNVDGKVSPGTEHAKWMLLGTATNPARGEWRWLHWRDRVEDRQPPVDGKPQPPIVSAKTWVTAVPLVQPWLFVTTSLTFTWFLLGEAIHYFRLRKGRST